MRWGGRQLCHGDQHRGLATSRGGGESGDPEQLRPLSLRKPSPGPEQAADPPGPTGCAYRSHGLCIPVRRAVHTVGLGKCSPKTVTAPFALWAEQASGPKPVQATGENYRLLVFELGSEIPLSRQNRRVSKGPFPLAKERGRRGDSGASRRELSYAQQHNSKNRRLFPRGPRRAMSFDGGTGPTECPLRTAETKILSVGNTRNRPPR